MDPGKLDPASPAAKVGGLRDRGEPSPAATPQAEVLPRVGDMYSQHTTAPIHLSLPPEGAGSATWQLPPVQKPRNEAAPKSIRLCVLSGPHQGETRVLGSAQVLIVGRAEDVQWQLVNEPYLSRYQFRIEANLQSFRMVDLGSKNGTWVNGARAMQRDLREGDRIECGPTVITVSFVSPSQ